MEGQNDMTISTDTTEKQNYLSPSAAARWIACPGSEYIIPRLPRLPSSDAAQEGTLAHEFAAYAAATTLRMATDIAPENGMPPEPEAALATLDMTEGAQTYADSLCSQCGKAFTGDFAWAVEMPVALDDGRGCRLRGRLDFAAWNEDALVIADYKFGGEFVPALNNPQLLSYAMCLADKVIRETGKSPDRVHLGIVQLRTEVADFSRGASWCSLDWPDFYSKACAIRESAKIATSADATTLRKTGDHCRWCPARSVCRAAVGERLLLAGIAAGEAEMTEDATDAQIGAWLDALRGMDTVRDDLTRIAKARIAEGAEIPGWRIMNRRVKQWAPAIRDAGETPREQAEAIGHAIGVDPETLLTETLRTPAQVAQTMPKDALASVTEETNSPALVAAKGRK